MSDSGPSWKTFTDVWLAVVLHLHLNGEEAYECARESMNGPQRNEEQYHEYAMRPQSPLGRTENLKRFHFHIFASGLSPPSPLSSRNSADLYLRPHVLLAAHRPTNYGNSTHFISTRREFNLFENFALKECAYKTEYFFIRCFTVWKGLCTYF